MSELILELHITPAQLLRYYRGEARQVQARALTGQTVQFPASALQRHVDATGINGRFRLEFNDERKFMGLERVL